jgi:hypothetical protein
MAVLVRQGVSWFSHACVLKNVLTWQTDTAGEFVTLTFVTPTEKYKHNKK